MIYIINFYVALDIAMYSIFIIDNITNIYFRNIYNIKLLFIIKIYSVVNFRLTKLDFQLIFIYSSITSD